MHTLLDISRNYEQGRNCKSDGIVYLNTPSAVRDLIHREFEEIEVTEY